MPGVITQELLGTLAVGAQAGTLLALREIGLGLPWAHCPIVNNMIHSRYEPTSKRRRSARTAEALGVSRRRTVDVRGGINNKWLKQRLKKARPGRRAIGEVREVRDVRWASARGTSTDALDIDLVSPSPECQC